MPRFASSLGRLGHRLAAAVHRPWVALAAIAVLAAALLVPGLGGPGLWEPQERALADKLAPPAEVDAQRALATIQQTAGTLVESVVYTPAPATAPPPAPRCDKVAPRDALARSLGPRALVFGRGLDDSDTGRRLPLVAFALVCVLATAGIALRLAGARAGLFAGIAVLTMPLLLLQSRLLASDLGTACGGALIVAGLLALARPVHDRGAALLVLDLATGAAMLAAGAVLGFLGGGALLGLVVPIGAVAAAGGLGGPAVSALAHRRRPTTLHVVALLAALVAAALLGVLAYQLYDLSDPYPGIVPPARQVLGQAVVPTGCWSSWLGSAWRPDDDLRYIFDSTFEQVGYGTFPWGVLGVIAIAALLRDASPARQLTGGLALAWAAGAWIATEVFQRKAGVAIYAGFPALAIAAGVWLDAVLARRGEAEVPAGGTLIGLFVALAVLDLGKDISSFAQRMTSLLSHTEIVAYPAASRLLGLPTKTWTLVLGAVVAAAFLTAMLGWRRRRLSDGALVVALAGTLALGAFWIHGWHRTLSRDLSSKTLFETYRALRGPGDQLVVQGDLGSAPRAYADEPTLEQVASRDQVIAALKRPNRVFAIAPQSDLCALHREIGNQPYAVLDDRNPRSLLLTNKLAGARDVNPLREMIVHGEPAGIATRPPSKIVLDGKLELVGWTLPATAERGRSITMTTYWKVLAPVGGNWKMFVHVDQGAVRIGGDHPPIKDRCPTSNWQAGDYIIDRHMFAAGSGGHPLGPYAVWIGMFTGSMPSFRNMDVSTAPQELRDPNQRVKIGTLVLQ